MPSVYRWSPSLLHSAKTLTAASNSVNILAPYLSLFSPTQLLTIPDNFNINVDHLPIVFDNLLVSWSLLHLILSGAFHQASSLRTNRRPCQYQPLLSSWFQHSTIWIEHFIFPVYSFTPSSSLTTTILWYQSVLNKISLDSTNWSLLFSLL